MGESHESFVDALLVRRDEVASRAAERIVTEVPGYWTLGDGTEEMVAHIVGSFFEALVRRWGRNDRELPGPAHQAIEPAAGIDLGLSLTDRLAAHRIGSEVAWAVVHEVAVDMPDLDTDFLLWATSIAFTYLNALTASVTEQHLEVEHHRRRWRRELQGTLVEAVLRAPPDLDLAATASRALGIEVQQPWQVVVVLQSSDGTRTTSGIASLGAWARRSDRTVLTSENGRETRVLVGGTPVEPDELDAVGTVAIGVGRPRRQLEDLAPSYERAHDAALVAERRGGGTLGVEATRLERFLEGRVVPDDLTDDLLDPLRRLPDDQAELIAESLEAYLDEQCSVTAAARRLHLHPQSFRYRLGKLESVFGDALHDSSGRLLLHIAIRRYRQGRTAAVDSGGSADGDGERQDSEAQAMANADT